MERTTARVAELIGAYDFSHAAYELYGAFWNEFCDWYLELVKPRLYDEDADREALSATLLHVLGRVLGLLHPVMPFVTEEVWSFLPGERALLASESWPEPDDSLIDEEAEAIVGRAIDAITAVRGQRDELGVAAGQMIPARLTGEGYDQTRDQIARLARLDLEAGDGEVAATVAVPGGTIELFAAEGVDAGAAAARLDARRKELEAEVARAEGKLGNEGFVAKAPPEVVEAEREKLEEYKRQLAELG
jgi:valyl-tRNA synthetase